MRCSAFECLRLYSLSGRLHFLRRLWRRWPLWNNRISCANSGFTLIELLVTIAVIGVLAAIAIPQYAELRGRALVASTASDLKNFSLAFSAYSFENGEYPIDTHNQLPPEMSGLINAGTFERATPLGGRYNWEGPNTYDYAGISIFEPTSPQRNFEHLDRMLDDGQLSSGRFRITSNGRYTYIIEEGI